MSCALLHDPDAEVAGAAIRAVARLRKRSLVPRVIDRLAEASLTEEAVAALASFGDGIVGLLRDAVTDERLPIETRRELPGAFPGHRARVVACARRERARQ